LIVEDDAELRYLTAALLEDEQMDTIQCGSAEAALATLLIGRREVAMIFADVRLRGVMDGMTKGKMISSAPRPTARRDRVQDRQLPPIVAYMPKPWQPLNVLIAAEQALASARGS
jgi:CheY-like chemotaxis protein